MGSLWLRLLRILLRIIVNFPKDGRSRSHGLGGKPLGLV
jgi:hypothetical protein